MNKYNTGNFELLRAMFPSEYAHDMRNFAAWCDEYGLIIERKPPGGAVIRAGGNYYSLGHNNFDWTVADVLYERVTRGGKRLYVCLEVTDWRPDRGSIIGLYGFFVNGTYESEPFEIHSLPHPKAVISQDCLRAQGLQDVQHTPETLPCADAFARMCTFLATRVDEYVPGDKIELIAWDGDRTAAFIKQWFELYKSAFTYGNYFFEPPIDVKTLAAEKMRGVKWRKNVSIDTAFEEICGKVSPNGNNSAMHLYKLYEITQRIR